MKLNLRRRTKKRLPVGEPTPLMQPQRSNQAWSADLTSDALYNGLRFCTFNVLDDFNREALVIEIDTSLPSQRLVRLFEQVKAERGVPDVLRTENAPSSSAKCSSTGALPKRHHDRRHRAGQAEPERLQRAVQSIVP